jgi:serine/threonine-protein kinase
LAAVELATQQARLAGTQIGGYTLERPLGWGGPGAPWLASRSDGRFADRYAIKFAAKDGGAELAEGLCQEGRLLASLSHPNIAQLVEVGGTEDGAHFLAVEYVAGESIECYCRSCGLSVPARIRLFLDAVSAVAYAHAQQVIHRDLKPANVRVSYDGTVKLLDFGVARDGAPAPDYAAPEQLLGELPCAATDVYQLGLMLYVLLTGKHPLQLSGTRAERIRAVLDSRIPLASQSSSAQLRSELCGDLDAILAKALDPQPSRRQPTAAILHDELNRYLQR